jgi:hypothetical protein
MGALSSGSITEASSENALDTYPLLFALRDNPICLAHSWHNHAVADTTKRNLGPQIPAGHILGEFSSYQDAIALVDRLVASDFAANRISIIGLDPVLVEKVRSKLGYGRIVLSGAITGFWLGILLSLLLGVGIETTADGQLSYNPQQFAAVLVVSAGIGMLINIIRFAASKNKRGFLSTQMPVASKYRVLVPDVDAAAALRALSAGGTE